MTGPACQAGPDVCGRAWMRRRPVCLTASVVDDRTEEAERIRDPQPHPLAGGRSKRQHRVGVIRVGDRRVRTKAKHVLPVLKWSFYLTTPPNVRSRSTVLWLIAAVITRVVSNNATAKGVSPF